MRWMIVVSIIISFGFGCSLEAEKQKAVPATESVISLDEAAGSIPCFRCHSYKNFTSAEKGDFPHVMHRDKGYHCNQCHISKPHHFIKTNTEVCNDCHNLRVITFKETAFPSKFNHESHAKLGCKQCHPVLFDMKIGSQKITMEPIYQGKLCGACHEGKKAFASSDCAKCHEMKGLDKELVYKVEPIGNVVFSHKFHTAMFSCNECHPKLFGMKKTEGKMPMIEMEKGKTCGACHNGKAASALTDCMKCHKG